MNEDVMLYQTNIVDRLVGLYINAHECAAQTGFSYPQLVQYRRKGFFPARLAEQIEQISRGTISASDVRQAAMNRV